MLPSVNDPVAWNCWVVPSAIEGVAGVTAMDTSAAAVTVRVVLLVMALEAAMIFVDPVPIVVASPCDPVALLMVATVAVAELQCTVLVMSCVLPSVNVPVAWNC